MSTFDYTDLLNTAVLPLLEEFGRAITLVRFTTTPSDPAKPWRGAVDPRAGATLLVVNAAMVEPDTLVQLGLRLEVTDLVKRGAKIFMTASTTDLEDFNEIKDSDNTTWKITCVDRLQPAETTLCYFLRVER